VRFLPLLPFHPSLSVLSLPPVPSHPPPFPQPALRGTLEALEAAHKSGTVKQFILTSSFAAMSDYKKGLNPGYRYTSEDWCPLTYEEAKATPDQVAVYVASKTFAEKAAWEFVEEKKPAFSLTTCVSSSTFLPSTLLTPHTDSILPTHVLGATAQPLKSLDGLSLSAAWLSHALDKPFLLPTPIPVRPLSLDSPLYRACPVLTRFLPPFSSS
jgi:hypothetical protein